MRAMVVLAVRAVIVSSFIAAAVACSDKPDAESSRAKAVGATTKSATAEVASTDMISAVTTGRSAVPVELRFDHAKRPEIGVPLDLVVSVVPTAPVDLLQVVFQAQDGVRITANSNLGPIARPTVGTEIRHLVTVTPLAEGVYSISAVVLVEASNGSLSRSYAIPLVMGPAGAGVAAPAGSASASTSEASENAARSP
jgi:hypothetical protein